MFNTLITLNTSDAWVQFENLKRIKAFCFLIIAQISLRYRLYFKAVTMYSTCLCIYNFYKKNNSENLFRFTVFFSVCVLAWKESKKYTNFALKEKRSNHVILKILSAKLKPMKIAIFCFKRTLMNWITGMVDECLESKSVLIKWKTIRLL